MKSWRKFFLSCLVNSFILGLANLAVASSEILIEGDTPFTDKIISSGAIKVSVTYKPFNDSSAEPSNEKNFYYQIYYHDKKQIEGSDLTVFTGEIFLKDLDSNGIDEVIIKTFSGGAHCCTNFIIYTWENNQFAKIETGLMDGSGGSFEDLDGDKKSEFLSYDNSFLYKFSSYAGSFPPSIIYTFKNGKFENVTRNYTKRLRETLQQMYEAIRQSKKDNYEINGILAGYVAQKILLGEYEDGWNFMLTNYDKKSDWGLEMYDNNGNVVNKYPDFPSALKKFLIEQGYLDKNGKPLP